MTNLLKNSTFEKNIYEEYDFTSLIAVLLLCACKKEQSSITNEIDFKIPMIRKDGKFKNGILVFDSREHLIKVYRALENNSDNANNIIPLSFNSLQKYFNKFRNSQYQNRTADDNIEQVDTAQYIYDMKYFAVEYEIDAAILNEDLQIIIDDTLFQVTRIGIFKIVNDKIDDFFELYEAHEDEILYNPHTISLPGEIPLIDGSYRVENGIDRVPAPVNILYDDSNPGIISPGVSYVPPCSITLPNNFQYATYDVDSDFKRNEVLYVESNTRRFKFETFNTNFLSLGVLRTIGIRGKLQRQRKFLGIKYWGESYADEIILNVENMDLHTDYVIPTPQVYNSLPAPQFNGLFNLKIGNHILEEVLDIRVNANLPFNQNISNVTVSNYLNGTLNSILNNQFQNFFSPFVNSLIANFDPSYPTRYANHAKRVSALKEANKVRYTLAEGAKSQGYSHVNVWRFDWNIGTPWGNGTTYSYEMKAGSFSGRARVGCKWYGIRIVRL